MEPPFHEILHSSTGHCIEKIVDIIAKECDDRRSILQLGYNLGRLSEMTGLGREAFWDRWKGSVEVWDIEELRRLARELPVMMFHQGTR